LLVEASARRVEACATVFLFDEYVVELWATTSWRDPATEASPPHALQSRSSNKPLNPIHLKTSSGGGY
jgi:hypothetical protein